MIIEKGDMLIPPKKDYKQIHEVSRNDKVDPTIHPTKSYKCWVIIYMGLPRILGLKLKTGRYTLSHGYKSKLEV